MAAALLALVLAAPSPAAPNEPPDAVTTTVLPDPYPNLPPVAVDRLAVVEADTASRTPSAVLDVYDLEHDAVSIASFAQPAHGQARQNADGTFTYVPQSGYTGSDEFAFTLRDGRGATASARMKLTVIRPSGTWATTSFAGLAEAQADGEAIDLGRHAVSVRAADWDGDGKIDLLAGAEGTVRWYRNVSPAGKPAFAAGAVLQAGGKDLRVGRGRLSIAVLDMDRDGRADLVIVGDDRKVRLCRNLGPAQAAGGVAASGPSLAEPVIFKGQDGQDFQAADVRADVVDWNGDRLGDILTGTGSGPIRVAYNVGSASAPAFAPPVEALDSAGLRIAGSYNLNVRLADLNQDGVSDLCESYNWGTIHFRINTGSARQPLLPETGTFTVTGPGGAKVNLHALTDGPSPDFADLNGDGTLDLILGCERGGRIRIAWGQGGQTYLARIRAIMDAHGADLPAYLADPAHADQKAQFQALLAALYDYVTSLATPSQKAQIARGLIDLLTAHPRWLTHRTFDLKTEPGMPSLGPQIWLTLLMTSYYDPGTRRLLADAGGLKGGHRKLVEDFGLIYAENAQNPRGAEAIWQWVKTIPRQVYPGTIITAADWLGGKAFLPRGHAKNTFNGCPVDGGEYGFGGDARKVIGERGSENWFMTVVRHEACHDLDAYVRRSPDLHRRWGQTLVLAGGPDMRADPKTGWLSIDLTRKHFREAGLWDGQASTWSAAWKKYWETMPGKGWRDYGFMRGNTPWFYEAPQESLATQGNQHWNSTEGRLQVAIDRWDRGYRGNITEVLLFLDIWSLGLPKAKFYEIDNASRQVIAFARLGRNAKGYIDRIDLGERTYRFRVDNQGVVTEILEAPGRAK